VTPICRFCGSNIAEEADSCPSCGKSSSAEPMASNAGDATAAPETVSGPKEQRAERKKTPHWMRRGFGLVWGWLARWPSSLATWIRLGRTTATSRAKRTSQRAYDSIRAFSQRVYFRTRVATTKLWDNYPIGRSVARGALVVALAYICWLATVRRWQLDKLDKGIVAQIPMFVGAAITGLIAISVALTLFAIQQLAQANGPTVMEEYARDKRRIFIYWSLTLCALGPFVIALFLLSNLTLDLVFAQLALLYISFELLNLHFHQAVRFSNPRYRIDLLLKRGTRQIEALRRVHRDIERRISKADLL
jgi:hypothetical protein